MAFTNYYKDQEPKVFKKTKIETTYEYVPLLREVLGFWRRKEVARIGETVEVHLAHRLEAYDRLLINGDEIEIKRRKND